MRKQRCRAGAPCLAGTYWCVDRAPGAEACGKGLSPLRVLICGCATLIGVALAVIDVHAGEIFIRASQIGYRPMDAKLAIAFSVFSLPDSFSIAAAYSGAVVFQGKTKPVEDVKWGQFENHAELDFSALTVQGRYVIRVGESKSLPFTISGTVYGELPDELLEFMREQRCGYNPRLEATF